MNPIIVACPLCNGELKIYRYESWAGGRCKDCLAELAGPELADVLYAAEVEGDDDESSYRPNQP